MDCKKFEQKLKQLTRTQKDVLELFLHGLDDKDIAVNIPINVATVRQHIGNIADKFDIPSDISDKTFRRRELIKIFRKFAPERLSDNHKYDEN